MFLCKRAQVRVKKEHSLLGADPEDHRRPADILLVEPNTSIDFVV